MKTSVDFIVMDLHVVVPAVDKLCEVRESEPLHSHLRGQCLAAAGCLDGNERFFNAGAAARWYSRDTGSEILTICMPVCGRLPFGECDETL